MSSSLWMHKPAVTWPLKCDLAIVGGGFVGLSTAYWYSEFFPDRKIVIIEKNHCGAGASGRNAGFLTKGSASFYKTLKEKFSEKISLKIERFAFESVSLTQKFLQDNSSAKEYFQTSSYTLFQKSNWEKFNNEEFDYKAWGYSEIQNKDLPDYLKTNFHCALEAENEASVNPVELLHALKEELLERGVQILEHITGYELNDHGVLTELGVIEAHTSVLALNGYLQQFGQDLKHLVIPQRAQMLAVKLAKPISSTVLHYDSPDKVYWKLRDPKTLLIGGKRMLDEKNENTLHDSVNPIVQKGLEDYLKNVLHVDYQVLKRWSGVMGFTQDELPYIEKLKTSSNTFIIGGFGGHGMGLGFLSARNLVELMSQKVNESFFSELRKKKL